MVNILLNILWALFGGGIITALEYLIAGLLCCLTIVGIPFGLQCFKIAGLALFPFGKDYEAAEFDPLISVANIVWVIFAGLWIFLSHLVLAVPLAVSIIGLPFAFQHLKLAMVAFAPFGLTLKDNYREY